MNKIGLIYAIGAALTWGLVYTIDERILTKASPGALLFMSSFITAILTIPFLIADKSPIKEIVLTDKTTFLLIIGSQILGVLASFLIFSSIKLSGAALASIIEISYPFFVVLFSVLLLKDQFNFYFWIGGIFMFIGAAIITYLT